MGEINHFSHEEHSLKLIENWETLVDDHGEKKGECAELPPTINHHFHPLHPLTLIVRRLNWYCDVCRTRHLPGRFRYRCSECDFDACIKCGTDEEHSLKLIENWETIVNDHDEKKGKVRCEGCRDPISILGGAAYGCISCRYFLHKACAELPPTINHHLHPFHPLTFYQHSGIWNCNVCRTQRLAKGFGYRCLEFGDFDACIKCGADVVSEEASMKLKHEGHPGHTLTLQLRRASFRCDACRAEDKDFFYQCDSCNFWIHKTCASLNPTINLPGHHHPLVLVYLLPDNFYNFKYYCEFCEAHILRNDWLYHCGNCRYFSHIKCALNAQLRSNPRYDSSTSIDDENLKDLLHFPMPYAFTDPLKLLHSGKVVHDDGETNKIYHSSHHHPLILNVEPQGNSMTNINSSDLIEVCYGCVRPLSFPYYSCSKNGCSFTLHKYCAQLPRTLQHELHPQHPLCLVKTNWFKCDGCYSRGNTFVYKWGFFKLCVNCAFLPNTIKHISHKHPIVQVINSRHECNACYKWSNYGISYACKACEFQLDMHCAMRLPQSLAHRYCKGQDEVLLTYPPVENHPEDFYCDICEEEMHPKRPLYHCQNHKNSFHLRCLSRHDPFENLWREGTVTVPYHKHPLTFVRRKKTPKYVCSKCNQDINSVLVLECRARVCNFNICYDCCWEFCMRLGTFMVKRKLHSTTTWVIWPNSGSNILKMNIYVIVKYGHKLYMGYIYSQTGQIALLVEV
ncbi:C1-like protein [Artemisia annua]|uniref:C1-like protein n=1 Tax=Artemisia annua TaxID=35608 RepID=A0A2U1MHL5_ARTAN|nr:C1-like protein [Artemisia annua]